MNYTDIQLWKSRLLEYKRTLKYLKLASFTFLSTFGVFYFSLLLFSIVINPNNHKKELQNFISSEDYNLNIQGPLEFTRFPTVSLHAHKVLIKESRILVKHLKLTPKFFPLLLFKLGFKLEMELQGHPIHSIHSHLGWRGNYLEFCDSEIHFKKDTVKIDQLTIKNINEIPLYHLKHKDKNFKLSTLLDYLGSQINLKGDTKIKINLTAQGSTQAAIKKTLNGTLALNISKGNIHGLDVIHSLDNAQSLLITLEHKILNTIGSALETLFRSPHPLKGITPFDEVKLTANIQEGKLKTDHFEINHKHYHLLGGGQIHFPKHEINCQIQAFYKHRQKTKHAWIAKYSKKKKKNPPLIISIKGPLNDPKIKADMNSYVQYLDKDLMHSNH